MGSAPDGHGGVGRQTQILHSDEVRDHALKELDGALHSGIKRGEPSVDVETTAEHHFVWVGVFPSQSHVGCKQRLHTRSGAALTRQGATHRALKMREAAMGDLGEERVTIVEVAVRR